MQAGLILYKWTGEEDNQAYKFSNIAWVGTNGMPIQYWNRIDLNMLMVNFARAQNQRNSLNALNMEKACLPIGCEYLESIPKDFNIVGKQLYKIAIKIISKIEISKVGYPSPVVGIDKIGLFSS